MNKQLIENIQKVKIYLNEKPERIMIGWVHDGIFDPDSTEENLYGYIEFLKVCDGASFGDICLFQLKDVIKYQFYVEILPGGRENWFAIGHVLDEPLILNKYSGEVFRAYRDDYDHQPYEHFGQLDDFLLQYAFGKKYMEIVPADEDDEWIKLLLDLAIINSWK